MNDFTLDELNVLVDVFNRANVQETETLATELQQRINTAQLQRQEVESLEFDDCLSCKL